jgi:hypothetical protein
MVLFDFLFTNTEAWQTRVAAKNTEEIEKESSGSGQDNPSSAITQTSTRLTPHKFNNYITPRDPDDLRCPGPL